MNGGIGITRRECTPDQVGVARRAPHWRHPAGVHTMDGIRNHSSRAMPTLHDQDVPLPAPVPSTSAPTFAPTFGGTAPATQAFVRSARLPPGDGAPTLRGLLRIAAVVLGTAAALGFLYAVRRVLLLLVLAILVAYVLAPVVALAQRTLQRLPSARSVRSLDDRRLSAVIAVYLVLLATLLAIGSSVAPRLGRQIEHLGTDFPLMLSGLQQRLQHWADWYQARRLPPGLRATLDDGFSQTLPAVSTWAQTLALGWVGALAYLPWLVLVPALAFFFLKDASQFRTVALRILPQGRSRWRAGDFFQEVNQVLATYVRVQLLVALFVAVVSSGILALCGVSIWLVLGSLAAVLEFIPLVGPVVFIVSAGVAAAAQGHALLAVGLLLCLRVLVGNVVAPALIRRGLRLHPLAIMLALLCGSQLGGMAGLFLAIPLLTVALVSYRHAARRRRGRGLISQLVRDTEPVAVPTIGTTSPRPPRRDGPLAPTQGSAVSLGGVAVLVVDNEAEAREMVALVLGSCGASVFQASSVPEAIACLSGRALDVLISDIGMPNEDGLDLIRKVRRLPPDHGGQVFAIALTGYSTEEDRRRILAAGFQVHLTKPVSSVDLVSAVRARPSLPAVD